MASFKRRVFLAGSRPTRVRVTAAVLGLALMTLVCARLLAANVPNFLLWPTDRGARISTRHGDEWRFATGCDGRWKRHVGIDIMVNKGRPVYAAEYGRVVMVAKDGGWGWWITLEHTDWQSQSYTTNYFHVNSAVRIGDRVSRGQQIATVYDLGSNSHLHFGIRNAPYSNVANRGALPATRSCGPSDPQWPENTLNPLDYTRP